MKIVFSEDKTLETAQLIGVEILAVGKWRGSNGEVEFTLEDLKNAVKAFTEITAKPELNYEPPMKLGHAEKQNLLQADGYPSAGWMTKLYVKGEKLCADFKDVPKAIAEIINAGGYKKCSAEVEFYRQYEIGGDTYPIVIKAVALLGADIPAVKTISDITECYASTDGAVAVLFSESGEYSIEDFLAEFDSLGVKAETLIKGKPGSPSVRTFLKEAKVRVRSMIKSAGKCDEGLRSVQDRLECVRQAFYDTIEPLIVPSRDASNEMWLRDVYNDHVIAEMTGSRLLKIPYTMDEATGKVTFSMDAVVPVVLIYQVVSTAPLAEATDKNKLPEEANMKELAKALGLAEDAKESDVLAALESLKTKASGTLSLAEAETLKEQARTATAKLAENVRDTAVATAISTGKITPAQKPWADTYALSDPAGFKAFTDAAPVVVKLGESGHSGDNHEIQLNENELKVAAKLGVSPAEVIKSKEGK